MSIEVIAIIASSLIISLLITGAVFYFAQERILFHPTPLLPNHHYHFPLGLDFEEFDFKTEHDGHIYGLHFKVAEPKGLLFYYHGNSGDMQRWGHWCEKISEHYNYDVVAADYRGFGKSTGKRGFHAMLNDAIAVYRYFEHIDLPKIIFGRSLGGSFASHVALTNTVPLLILESTFTRTMDVGLPFLKKISNSLILRFPFQNIDNLKNYKGKLILIHGDKDMLITAAHSRRLYKMAKSRDKQLIMISGANHRNLESFDEYWLSLENYLI